MDHNNAIIVKNLSKSFDSVDRKMTLGSLMKFKFLQTSIAPKFKALDNINFSVPKGGFFGIIGRNGSGKSTLMRILLGSIYPDAGSEVHTHGKVIKLAMGMGFNNNLSARDNIYINGSILGMSFKEIGDEFDSILDFAGVADFVDFPLKKFSSGMRARLAFAIAIKTKADVFLLDEFFGGVGDIGFKKKSNTAFEELLKTGKTVVIVSHSMNRVAEYCENILLLNKGQQIGLGSPKEIIPMYESLFKKKNKNKQ